MLRAAFWVCQDINVARVRALVADVPTHQGGPLRADCGLVYMVQNHFNLLSGKVHAVVVAAVLTTHMLWVVSDIMMNSRLAADAAMIFRDIFLLPGDGIPHVLAVDHD